LAGRDLHEGETIKRMLTGRDNSTPERSR
jgi:hypothetical protein